MNFLNKSPFVRGRGQSVAARIIFFSSFAIVSAAGAGAQQAGVRLEGVQPTLAQPSNSQVVSQGIVSIFARHTSDTVAKGAVAGVIGAG